MTPGDEYHFSVYSVDGIVMVAPWEGHDIDAEVRKNLAQKYSHAFARPVTQNSYTATHFAPCFHTLLHVQWHVRSGKAQHHVMEALAKMQNNLGAIPTRDMLAHGRMPATPAPTAPAPAPAAPAPPPVVAVPATAEAAAPATAPVAVATAAPPTAPAVPAAEVATAATLINAARKALEATWVSCWYIHFCSARGPACSRTGTPWGSSFASVSPGQQATSASGRGYYGG